MFVLCRNTNTGRLTVKEQKKVNALNDEVLYMADTKDEADEKMISIIALGIAEFRKRREKTS